jgi:uncharacterized protein
MVGGMEEVANQLLTFELPITEATQLAGPVTANLSFSCTEIDSYVLARLSRIGTDGTRHLLSLGGIRPVSASPPAPSASRQARPCAWTWAAARTC